MTDLFDYKAPRSPWWPHVYIMRCVVNETMLSKLSGLRQADPREPEWMAGVRAELAPSVADIEGLRAQPFVKIGSTYGDDPSYRPRKLANPSAPGTTMMCRQVPVVGKRVICYMPGEEEIERALHARWATDRIDPEREFFWVNGEMRELAKVWGSYDPNPPKDFALPFSQTWWGEAARSNMIELGLSK